jgi:hypothetical protein
MPSRAAGLGSVILGVILGCAPAGPSVDAARADDAGAADAATASADAIDGGVAYTRDERVDAATCSTPGEVSPATNEHGM